MTQKVGIVGVAQTKYKESRADRRAAELAFEVTEEVLMLTGLTNEDLDVRVTCSQDHLDGRGISDCPISEALGAQYASEEKVAADGAFAVRYGLIKILSGHYDVVLVVGQCKESKVDQKQIGNLAFEPIYHRQLGFDFLSAAALQANRYLYKYGVTREQCARVVVKNLANAKNNPYAQRAMDVSVEDVLNSNMVAYPLGTMDIKPESDGACAMILAREDIARRLTDQPVWIRGVGTCYDKYYLGDRDLADCDALMMAAKRAYSMAGIEKPLKEIHVAEISEEYSYQELLWCEGLGLCERGGGGRLIEERVTYMEGELPVNPSGGLLSGCPTHVAGLSRVAEAALQLKGQCGERQINGARTALAHGVGGACGQMQCVLILSK